jgi:hypothetical protein
MESQRRMGMKRLLVLLCVGALGLALLIGCGQQEEAEEHGAAGMAEEMADTTRMDSAMIDSMADTMMSEAEGMMDEAEGDMEQKAEEMKEGTGH